MEYVSAHWIFSTTAQSIATLIAFLLTGYIYKISFLNQRLKDDKNLKEIIPKLKIFYNKYLKIILYLGGGSIIFNIISLYFPNTSIEKDMIWIYIFTIILSFITIIGCILFIWILLNEERETMIAKQIYKNKFKKNLNTSQTNLHYEYSK